MLTATLLISAAMDCASAADELPMGTEVRSIVLRAAFAAAEAVAGTGEPGCEDSGATTLALLNTQFPEYRADREFVVLSLSRTDIADALGSCEETRSGDTEFAADDARLTDEFCKRYATAINELEGERNSEEWSMDTYLDKMGQLDTKFARELGLNVDNVDEDEESDDDDQTAAEAEFQLARGFKQESRD